MNCKNCKYFYRDTSTSNRGGCKNDKIDYNREIDVGDEVSYFDAENYAAILIVGEDFGCIHFEQK